MPTFNDFYFDSSTGKNHIHVRRCIPDVPVRGYVQIMHGIAEHIERYDDFMQFLAENGFVAVGTDHLGHGKTIEAPEQKGFLADKNGWDYIIKDEEILRRAMEKTYPGIPFILFGHSMGSFMARTHLIRYPGAFDAAIISGTGNNGITPDWFFQWLKLAVVCFPMALCTQIFFVGPLVRLVFRTIFKKQLTNA